MASGKEVTVAKAEPFDPQNSQSVSAAMTLLRADPNVPKDFLRRISETLEAEITGDDIKIPLPGAKRVKHNVLTDITKSYDILAVKGTDQVYYARPVRDGYPLSTVYEPMDREELTNIVTDAYERITGIVDGADVERILDSLDKKIRKERTIPRVDNTLIQLIPGRYWNTENGDLYEELASDDVCFRRLFNTPKASRHIVHFKDGAFDDYAEYLDDTVSKTVNALWRNDGDLKEDPDFEFISVWAAGDHGIYMDILRMFATFFMKEKPLGTYILEGNGRNGKSSLIGLIHTLMGTKNTSRLQLAELGNWHKNHCLANTLVNAPDEEKPGTLEDTDLFRTIADHGDIELDVMRGQKPLSITCDFQCVSASNHMPEWKGTDAEACIRRARIIPFRADLAENDNKNYNFEEETYTPKRLVHFLGVVLGVAKFYMDKDFPESESVAVQREILQESMVSYRIYYDSFTSFFGKYDKLRTVYDDYAIWCKDRGYQINKYNEFKDAFNASRGKRTHHSDRRVDRIVVFRVSKLDACFYDEWLIPEATNYGTIRQMHEEGISVVTVLEKLREHDLGELVGKDGATL